MLDKVSGICFHVTVVFVVAGAYLAYFPGLEKVSNVLLLSSAALLCLGICIKLIERKVRNGSF